MSQRDDDIVFEAANVHVFVLPELSVRCLCGKLWAGENLCPKCTPWPSCPDPDSLLCCPERKSQTKVWLVPKICRHNHLADTCKECK